MKSQSLRLGLAAVLFIVAVILLLASSLPETRLRQVLPMPPVVLPTETPLGWLFFWRGC